MVKVVSYQARHKSAFLKAAVSAVREETLVLIPPQEYGDLLSLLGHNAPRRRLSGLIQRAVRHVKTTEQKYALVRTFLHAAGCLAAAVRFPETVAVPTPSAQPSRYRQAIPMNRFQKLASGSKGAFPALLVGLYGSRGRGAAGPCLRASGLLVGRRRGAGGEVNATGVEARTDHGSTTPVNQRALDPPVACSVSIVSTAPPPSCPSSPSRPRHHLFSAGPSDDGRGGACSYNSL